MCIRDRFYSLLAESTLLFNKAPFENVIVMGHVQDENGQKMSKSKGNAVDPFEALSAYGADAIRWYFYTSLSLIHIYLRNMIEMTKQGIGYTDPGKDLYYALLEQCEEVMDQATIDRLFEEVKTELIPLVEQITAKKMPENPTFHAYADPDAQRRVQWLLLDYIGFRRDAGAVSYTHLFPGIQHPHKGLV